MTLKYLTSILLLTLLISSCGSSSPPNNTSKELSSEPQAAQYTCAMHPHYISTDPNGTCPICGMDLVPVSPNSASEIHSEPNATITVSNAMRQTIGVRTAPVQIVEFGRALRAFGTVEADQRLENVSVSRLEGWVENLKVRAAGDAVNNGDLLYLVYSPDLVAAQRDYVNALVTGDTQRIMSVKQRLLSTGMQEQALQELAARKSVIDKVPVYAESDGIVAQLNIRDGDYVKPGTAILTLQSYRQVWVIASIPETDLPLIDLGISAGLRFPSAPDAAAHGKVNYIYPTIDPSTRTGRVRIEVDNTNGDLLPGAYADISLSFSKRARLSTVSEAILRDSRGEHVIIDLGQGRFGTRAVTTGISADGRTEILSGLKADELVVASGQFMLDSEVNLREGLSKLSASKPSDTSRPDNEQINAAKQPLSALTPDAGSLAKIDHFVDMALYFHMTLVAQDSIDPKFVEPAILLADELIERYIDTELAVILQRSKSALLSAQTNLHGNELAADLQRLMSALEPWLLHGAPQHYADLGLALYRESTTQRLWLQKGGAVTNPYQDSASNHTTSPEKVSWPEAGYLREPNAAREHLDPHAGHR
ncbi:efflux RND transporter periplasmic adaptor subunit [Arenicella xantha]|uniref:Cu(I)/Ag(I) efflux system membrane fusion protein n=1 Tax=Arenicella xantha TaxID=644221 RepID=A0A395JIW9_9GAMM|nr:efflux RND transporter periplasmic adaptor subunit [Arenicella xantha]RBP50631.1 Cu(I)/Ag(I) efflux system membrane fusion protein [Arenicella xantha]